MELTTEYRGWEIKYHEHTNEWFGSLDTISMKTSKGLAELKKKIDAALKQESKFKDMSVIVESRYGNRNGAFFRKIIITSVNELGECWIKNSKGSREKLYKDTVIYADNEDNLKIISTMDDKENQIKRMRVEIDEIQKTLEVVTPS